jgi:3-oxoacyl-[acyl-carrier-protein] synthase II
MESSRTQAPEARSAERDRASGDGPGQFRRVVVTGVGAISPLGVSAEDTWRGLLAGESGIRCIESFDASDLPVQIAGEVRGFSVLDWVDRKTARQMTRFAQYAVAASGMALQDACLKPGGYDPERAAVVIGTGAGGTASVLEAQRIVEERGPMRLSPFQMITVQYNMASYNVASVYQFLGPNLTVSTACTTGAQAIGEAAHYIRSGQADVALAGGAEHCVFPLVVAGFAVQRALSTRNDEPEKASRPFEADRDGFVIGEGAAVIVLESLEHALARGVPIYAELIGYGTSSDGFHPIVPDPAGRGVVRAIEEALREACLRPDEIDYVNAHAAGTPIGDKTETLAIKKAFGKHARRIAISSTKSMTGHLMGAAGAIEAMATILTIRDQVIHPTINYDRADAECDLDYVPNVARSADVRVAMSNSIGVGGQNASLIVARYPAVQTHLSSSWSSDRA